METQKDSQMKRLTHNPQAGSRGHCVWSGGRGVDGVGAAGLKGLGGGEVVASGGSQRSTGS